MSIREGTEASDALAMTHLGNRARSRIAVCSSLGIGLFAISAASALSPTPFSIAHWDSDQELPPGPVTAICQTRDGYLWFATEEGLARFDGAGCRTFDPGNTAELKTARISALHEDRAGTLWIGTFGGGLIQLQNLEMTRFGGEEGLQNTEITAIAEDPGGTLWVGTDGGGLYRRREGRFERFRGEDGLLDLFVFSLATDPAGSVWVAHNTGLRQLRDGRVVRSWRKEELGIPDVVVVFCDADGALWIGSKEGLFTFVEGQLSQQLLQPPIRNVQAICNAPEGGLWVGTAFGLYHVRNKQAVRWTTAEGLTGNVISSLAVDHEGSLWIGNNASGVDQLKRSPFTVFSTRHGLTYQVTTCVYEDSQRNMWIGTERGLNRVATDGITRYTTNHGLSLNLVFTVCEDPRGGLWVGTLRGLNYLVDGRFTVFRTEDGLPSSTIWCSYRDRDNHLWFGTRDGLVRWHAGRFHRYDHDQHGLSHNDVRAITQDSSGRLWAGTSYGLNLLAGERFTVFREAGPGHQFKVVLALHGDAEGSLWIGTMDKGLFRHRAGRFDHFTRSQGLFDDRIHQILEDEQGHLWMSCNRGIFSVAKSDLEAVAQGRAAKVRSRVFGRADGLVSVECNGTIQPAGWKSHDGRLWFPTIKGVAVIDPQNVPRNHRPPPVVIEKVLIDGQPAPPGSVSELPPGTERLEIRYAGLSFLAPDQVAFKYRLEDYDRNWITNRGERVAHYTRVPPGNYQFRVFACNSDGVWNPKGALLAFVVRPFFWQTGWFRLLALCFTLGTTGLLVRWWAVRKHRRELQAVERQHALERERTRIAQDMHDGLGSNLVKISLLSEVAEGDLDRPEAARVHIQKMASTARATVRDMDEIVWAVNPQNDTVDNLANYLCAFAREHFELTPIRLHLEVPAELPAWPLPADARHNLFLAAKEGLNNIVKHAQASEAWLQIDLADSNLLITIRDNGRGLAGKSGDSSGRGDRGHVRHGHGQDNIRERLGQIGCRFACTSEPGRGTTLIMKLPLGSRH